ncbi:MAG: lytic transglycosylase domain-containing protein [Deltaproteobacteria bacterium]|nr:lytic transglycosylase domain-containing protein [Deltaproteobacteria bacterium]
MSEVVPYGFPSRIEAHGLTFASHDVPLSRHDVRTRILHEINHLLLDRRSKLLAWLSRADALRHVISPILSKYGVPSAFLYLAAIESSYDPRALSSAGAFGYWQFIKSTALHGPPDSAEYDWKMNITSWKDERADLIRSTHAAARYLAWMNAVKKIDLNTQGQKSGFQDWLLAAAAYNAGPARVIQRMNLFGASSYWDVPLPSETERYVPRLIAVWIISNHRKFYDVHLPGSHSVAFDTLNDVRLVKDLPFAAMAKLLGTTPRDVWRLNSQIPAEKAVFPARSGRTVIPHTIHVPKGKAKEFRARLVANGYTKK